MFSPQYGIATARNMSLGKDSAEMESCFQQSSEERLGGESGSPKPASRFRYFLRIKVKREVEMPQCRLRVSAEIEENGQLLFNACREAVEKTVKKIRPDIKVSGLGYFEASGRHPKRCILSCTDDLTNMYSLYLNRQVIALVHGASG